jgi:hypothetical protein
MAPLRHSLAASALFLSGCVAEAPQPFTGGDVRRQVASDGQTTISGRATGDACGPPPGNLEQRTTVELDSKVLDYVKAGGKVENLADIKQLLAGADLGCDAVMYRACKVCFSTQNGQGCMALTMNALAYCKQRTGGSTAAAVAAVPAAFVAPAPAAPAPAAPIVSTLEGPGAAFPILRLIVSLWTDTDDKDREENVSVRVLAGQDIIATGGPWGGGELWSDQERRNNGQPHDFIVPLTRTVLLRDVGTLRLEIIKSQCRDNGGKGWHFKPSVIAETAAGKTEVWRSMSTIKLGQGHSAVFSTQL